VSDQGQTNCTHRHAQIWEGIPSVVAMPLVTASAFATVLMATTP
jgi:hypothetical protein